jgi:PTS system nitrogen regulatory IIA component
MDRPVAIGDLLGPGAILAQIDAPNKKQLLQDLSQHASAALGLEAHDIFDILWERERLGTTGVGYGIAIPHGRIGGLTQVRGFFARLSAPVAFEAVDDRPVDLVFLLLSPESAGADHLHALATVSRLLRDSKLCESLREARDAAALERLLSTAATAQAA